MTPIKKADRIAELQMDILRLEGFNSSSNAILDVGLEPLKDAFPNGSFPLGAVHEFLSARAEDSASTGGFFFWLLASPFGNSGPVLWIRSFRTPFSPSFIKHCLSARRLILHSLP